METLLQDLRFAARSHLRARASTLIAVVCLALGIGANTAIFSAVRGVLLSSLPYANAAQLVHVGETEAGHGPFYFSPPNFFDVRAQRGVFIDVAAWTPTSRDLGDADAPERLRGTRATANLFQVLGSRPIAGRTFVPSDTLPGQSAVVVISEGLWRRRFGADPRTVGSQITLNGVKHEVIGIMPAPFDFPLTPVHNDFWVVLDWRTQGDLNNRLNHSVQAVGRLSAGVDSARAMVALAPLARRLEAQFPQVQKTRGFLTVSLQGSIVGNVRMALLVLLGAVGLVLLIACANVANLLLVRAAGRRRELAIRAAIGAARGRLVSQLITESVLLALSGGVLGLFVAKGVLAILLSLAGSILPRADSVGLQGSVLLFAAAVSVLTGAVFGVVPALRATRTDLRQDLSDAAGRSSAGVGRHRTLNTLMVAEVALSLVLLTGAGLTIRSFAALLATDAGFKPGGVLTFRANPPAVGTVDSLRYVQFYGPVLDRIRALPGVRSAGFTNLLPIQDGTTDSFIEIAGHPKEPDASRRPDAQIRYVSNDYFRTLHIAVVAGRELTDRDRGDAPRVMVVNERLVERFMPNEKPLGKQIDPGDGVPATIVGVVKSVHQVGLDRPAQPELYLSAAQSSRQLSAVSFVVATDGDPLALSSAVRNAVRAVAPAQPVYQLGSMDAVINESLKVRRLVLVLLAGFALLALGLSAAGVYGVMSYGVSQRTREIGIRMALGANRGSVTSMILGDVAKVIGLGVATGFVGAAILSRVMQGVLYGVGTRDPVSFLVASGVIGGVAILAGAIPALRASRVDPLVAMRSD